MSVLTDDTGNMLTIWMRFKSFFDLAVENVAILNNAENNSKLKTLKRRISDEYDESDEIINIEREEAQGSGADASDFDAATDELQKLAGEFES